MITLTKYHPGRSFLWDRGVRNDKWVASRFELSCRHDNLTFKHHREVASLEPEEAAAIKEYDELKRRLEGSKPRGRRWNNSPQCSELEDGWSQEQTAKDLGISRQAVGKGTQTGDT